MSWRTDAAREYLAADPLATPEEVAAVMEEAERADELDEMERLRRGAAS